MDVRDSRAVIRYLVALWDERARDRKVTLPAEHVRSGVVIRALVAHAVDMGRAIVTLYGASLPIAAPPLVRVLIEDSVTAGWLQLYPEKHRAFLRKGVDQRRKFFEDVMAWDPTASDVQHHLQEAKEISEALTGEGAYVIQQVINDLEHNTNLYAVYRILTGQSHAGVGVVDLYTRDTPDTPTGLSFRSFGQARGAAGIVGTAASMLLQAMIAWDCTLQERQWKQELTELATRLGVQPRWRKATRD